MAYNDILEELRAKLGDSPDENEKILKAEGERLAKEGDFDGLKAVGELIMENMPEERRNEIDRLTHLDGKRLNVVYDEIDALIKEKKYLEALPIAEKLYKKICLEYAETDKAKFVSLRNPFEDNLCQLLFSEDKTLNRTPFNFTMYLTTYAYLLIETGANIDAIPVLEKAIAYNPIDVAPRFELAEIYKLIKNKKMVLDVSRETLKVSYSPLSIARCYSNIGYALTDSGDFEDAAAFYVASVMFAPNPAVPYEMQHLADLKGTPIRKPSIEEMVAVMKKYDIEYGPDKRVIEVSAQLAAHYMGLGDKENAVQAMKITYNLTLDEDIKKLILQLDPRSQMLHPKDGVQTDFDPNEAPKS
ncbi:MAG: tetratricopeptide repeat protein [Ruminococcus sp.]|nr:tetratricopeptide repeat protein [Ruminococcus sp.]